MKYSARDYQSRCWAYGINAGPIDGIWGSKTASGVMTLMQLKGVQNKEEVFHESGLHRVVLHWTAGAYGDIALERKHYHVLVMEDGRVQVGDHLPEKNAIIRAGDYAAHTRSLNSGSIGVAVDAMSGARERPFDAGDYPITDEQIDGLADIVADLCETYDIPISKYSVLTHAEVQPTLNVAQRGKWDITWLPGMSKPGEPVTVGNMIRKKIQKSYDDLYGSNDPVLSEFRFSLSNPEHIKELKALLNNWGVKYDV